MGTTSLPVSPFAPKTQPAMPTIAGVTFATMKTGARDLDRPDLLLAAFDEGTTAAGVFTQSKTRSAAVEWSALQCTHGTARALVVNSGNANAFTGMRGQTAVEHTAKAAASALGCEPKHVYIASTGVIGEPLDTSHFNDHLTTLARDLKTGHWLPAANAIMTTDTFPKMATRTVRIGGVNGADVTLNGFCKGSGMIAPDMATMLAFVFTDAHLSSEALRYCLADSVGTTFNAITVDSDTSTSDTLIAFATGKAKGAPFISSTTDPGLTEFKDALHDLLREMAMTIARDGEGITKFVTINVEGAENPAAAKAIAFSIANSPLVKTAIAGEDANWGRIVMAVGKAGEQADRDKLSIWFGPHRVATQGERDPGYDEDVTSAYMKNDEIEIKVNVGIAQGNATVWTCDLTHGYININADYRT